VVLSPRILLTPVKSVPVPPWSTILSSYPCFSPL
jgi:hypothetical protein